MKSKLEKAVCQLHERDTSCVIINGKKEVWSSEALGIKPLMSKLREDKAAFTGCVIADRVVGKAAALLAVLGGADAIYGEVMSESAATLLEQKGMYFEYETKVPYIENRTRTGRCPMEEAVLSTDDPKEAFLRLEETIKGLMEQKAQQ